MTDVVDDAARFCAREERSRSGVAAVRLCAWMKARAHV